MQTFLLKIYYFFIGFLTKFYLRRTRPLIIGITGSVGKTSCRMIVTQVLKQLLPEKRIYTSPKNFNSEIGLILSIFQVESYEPTISNLLWLLFKILSWILRPQNTPDILVLEYWIDHPHDMKFLTMISKADIAIFTKLDAVHSTYFKTVEDIGNEKFLLMKSARKRVYLNAFDDYCRGHAENLRPEVRFYNQWDLEVQDISYITEEGNVLSYIRGEFWEIKTNLMGKENMAYILLWIDMASYIWEASIHEETHTFHLELQPGRFHVFSSRENILIDSTYNAAPESMKVMIENTKTLRETLVPEYKLWFLLWDMRELWENSEHAHRWLVSALLDADFIFTVWPEMKAYVVSELLKNNFKWLLKDFTSSREAGKELKTYLESIGNKSVVLLKWSQNTIFTEEALKELLEDEADKKQLVRQSDFWMRKKEEFFNKK